MANDIIDDSSPRDIPPVLAAIPAFLLIKSSDIERWAVTLPTRILLPVLLRKLIHSTGRGLRRVDFPGYDDAERHGNDGYVEADESTPWIPEGRSYWEFGTNEDVKTKANKDYAARLKSITVAERSQSTFVFVTPRIWKGKASWESKQKARGDWKNIRVFDASDLEQWLEQSIPAQIWIAEQCGRSTQGTTTLATMWESWSGACDPKLSPLLFSKSVVLFRESFITWLNNPPSKPFLITADSRSEGLAFLHCLFDALQDLNRDRAVVVQSIDALRMLVTSPPDCILILDSDDLARELGVSFNEAHTILVMSRGVVFDIKPDIPLGILDTDTFHKALDSMGINHSRSLRLIRESGLSPTILRRRLAINPSIRKPLWANESAFVQKLLPLVFAGAWVSDNSADQEILRLIADREYSIIEKDMSELLQQEDCPVWSMGIYRGVVSQLDALFTVAVSITGSELDKFLIAAEYVLSETDPSLSLPSDARWAAPLYGKIRQHSPTLRQSIYQMLILLAVHGNSLFSKRLGINVEQQIFNLIRKLLTPLTKEKLLSDHHDLPKYAEAAPDTFLSIIESDLNHTDPLVSSLFQETHTHSIFSSPHRTGLLWALECLAWNPHYLIRVVLILGRLSTWQLTDNWVNKPDNSLLCIFRSWLPQTSASVDLRMKAFDLLATTFPEIAWAIGIDQLRPGEKFGHSTYTPWHRNDANMAEVLTNETVFLFNRHVLDRLLAWPSLNEVHFGNLVEIFDGIPEDDQIQICMLIEQWAQNATDIQKARLREHIRQWYFAAATRKCAKSLYDQLCPTDLLFRYDWLFTPSGIRIASFDMDGDTIDYDIEHQRTDMLRRNAVDEIWNELGVGGIQRFVVTHDDLDIFGRYTALCIADDTARHQILEGLFSFPDLPRTKIVQFLQGFFALIANDERVALVRHTIDVLSIADQLYLLLAAPFDHTTWELIDTHETAFQADYWGNVNPVWSPQTIEDINTAIDAFIGAHRSSRALSMVYSNLKYLETPRIVRLLQGLLRDGLSDPSVERFVISEAFTHLNTRDDISFDDLVWLEFGFIHLLEQSDYGIPNLQRLIALSPIFFAQTVAMVYVRHDQQADPPDWPFGSTVNKLAFANRAYTLLEHINMVPGVDTNGVIDVSVLSSWIDEVRSLCADHDRVRVGDQRIGMLLTHAPSDADGTWPCRAVCATIESLASSDIDQGFYLGVRNYRHGSWRRLDSSADRDQASNYDSLADQAAQYPRVAAILRNVAASFRQNAEWIDTEDGLSQRFQ